MMKKSTIITAVGILCVFATTPSFAHVSDVVHQHSLFDGFIHPFTGMDHLLAMIAIGLWAGSAGGVSQYVWPLAFLIVAGLSATLAHAGLAISFYELLIAISVVLLGLCVCFKMASPVLLGTVICGLAAFGHGYAHGIEMPMEYDISSFLVGFLTSTALIHMTGVALSVSLARSRLQFIGLMISAIGSFFVMTSI